MAKQLPSWAVVATVDESPALVRAFVAWYLSLGAAEIFLYFDCPDDPAMALFDDLPNVKVVGCDIAHWHNVGRSRPRRHQVRQVRNARQAYAAISADWLLHIDADEFIWPTRSVAETLHDLRPELDALILPVAERILTRPLPTQMALRGPFRKAFVGRPGVGKALFGPDYDLTHRGLTGHSLGKSFVRAGRPLNMSIHRPRPHKDQAELGIGRATTLLLLHFDGLTPLYWQYKLLRMADALLHRDGMPPSPHRRAQADRLLQDPQAVSTLHDALKVADQTLLHKLTEHNLLISPPFDPLPACERYFPKTDHDLSMAALDSWLRHEKASIFDLLKS